MLVCETECLWFPKRHWHRKDTKEEVFNKVAATLVSGGFAGRDAVSSHTLGCAFAMY